MVSRDGLGMRAAPQKVAFGLATWGWGLLIGAVLWALGFALMPWWVALLVWWWPSIITGAALSLATIAAAQFIARRTARGRSLAWTPSARTITYRDDAPDEPPPIPPANVGELTPEVEDARLLERVPQKWIRFCDKNALKLLNREHDSTIRRFRLIASCSRSRSAFPA